MANRLTQAAPAITRAFDQAPSPVLRERDIRQILEANRREWRLARSTNFTALTRFLARAKKLKRISLGFPSRPEARYLWGSVSPLLIAASVKPRAYLCQQTAMRLHGLTDQDSRIIYVNAEQRPLPHPEGPLIQEAMDRAFRGRQRVTKNRAPLGQKIVCLLNGKHTSQLGVITMNDPDGRPILVTGLERTLIDVAVRPGYAGGTASVLEAYRRAKGRFSVKEMATMLTKLDFIYPYHQAIGFYLDRSGACSEDDFAALSDRPFTHKFYLDYGMKEREFSERWQIWHPTGL